MSAFLYYSVWEWINISVEFSAAFWLRLPRFFLAVVAVNLLTHPFMVLFQHRFDDSLVLLCLGEMGVIVAETILLIFVYGTPRWRRVVIASCVMNAASFGTGLLVNT